MELNKIFKDGLWSTEINVRDFVSHNITPYYGDASFLEGPDVYKRQYRYGAEQQGGNRSAGGKGQEQRGYKQCFSHAPVSYTHLDVYKRQE